MIPAVKQWHRSLEWIVLMLLMIPGMLSGDVFIKIPGIPGESKEPKFEKWIDVLSLGFEGRMKEGLAGSMVVSKGIDQASLPLKVALAKGRPISEVIIILRRGGGGEEQNVFAKVELRDVIVTASIVEGSLKQDQILEQVGLSFRQIFYSYQTDSGEETSAFVEVEDLVDTDEDGMSDSFEDFYGFDKLVGDGHVDSDKDGFTNLEEFRLGLNPLSASSTFRLNALRKDKEGGVRLHWKTKPGKTYRIYTSPSLDKPFQLFQEVTASALNKEIDLGKLGLKGFYRVELVDE